MECILGMPDAIEEYYEVAKRIRDIDKEQVKHLVARFSSSLLVPGRIIILLKDDAPAVIVQQQRNVPGTEETLMKGNEFVNFLRWLTYRFSSCSFREPCYTDS